jgi:hypothetical protein
MEPGLYEVEKVGEWRADEASQWSLAFEVKRNHEPLTAGVLVIDSHDALRTLLCTDRTDYVTRRGLDLAAGEFLRRMLMSGHLPDGAVVVDGEIADRALRLISDPLTAERLETSRDESSLAVCSLHANRVA